MSRSRLTLSFSATGRKSEERYRLLFDQNLAGIVRSTIAGKIVDCNDALVRMYGYDSRDDVAFRLAQAFYADPEQRADLMARLVRTERRPTSS